MSTRICVFKDCHNLYSRVNSACNDVTIFSFPKDPVRAAQWRLLGQVHPKITPKELFMCSKHFDRKYLSITKNRTILLGQAVPNAYEKDAEDSKSAENEVPARGDSPATEPMEEEEQQTFDSDQNYIISLDEDQQSVENLIMIESSNASDKQKVKQFGVSIVTPSRKRAHSPTPSADSAEELADEEHEEEQAIDSTEVTIFQLKGEEYVQMSRQYYEKEKRQMLNQLRTYKQVLSSFKTQLKALKDI